MIAHPIKQLLTLIGQAGGVLTLPLAELAELGVEISATNICSDKGGELVLRLGPKIYYIPAPQEGTEQWQPETTTAAAAPTTSRGRGNVSRTSPQQPDPLAQAVEAVNRLTNRPRPPQPPPPAEINETAREELVEERPEPQRSRQAARTAGQYPQDLEDVLPHSRVGVTRLDDAALWLREQATEMDRREQAKRHRAQELREGELPFRTVPGR